MHLKLHTTHFTLYTKHYTLNFTLFIRLGVSGGRPDPSNRWHQPQAPPAGTGWQSQPAVVGLRLQRTADSWQFSSVFFYKTVKYVKYVESDLTIGMNCESVCCMYNMTFKTVFHLITISKEQIKLSKAV